MNDFLYLLRIGKCNFCNGLIYSDLKNLGGFGKLKICGCLNVKGNMFVVRRF